ncbi:Leucine-rich, ribonuclease inhibitor subtype [Angomonas deanei]|uniref:Leucine Rich repeat n=1 Tax=Angomonas deanei TaxID=59799 RepID=A0A7G2CLJ8_9TRYP|nr:Leucine-rich, ribonuclease inhibitor subtype [Angomonas deanei]CAD2220730.1 hypothetical protein, conserved [Angomonas deanei]|eukprot:EPY29329.1 Leucine-rich, ribonuclease inhibitor subtype [Angomonas deanei]
MLSQSVQGPFTGDIDSRDLLHDVMKYMPYNRRTLTSMRCVSHPFRSAVQNKNSPWSGHREILLSHYGQCVLFNAQEDDSGKSSFELYSISPIGRKFRTYSAKVLNRYHTVVASGLTKLALHHSQIDSMFFEHLAALTNLRELELISCRSITSISEAKRAPNLERLEVAFCPLEQDGVNGLLLPNLKSFTLRSCNKLSNLNGIAPETAAALEVFNVESCNVYDDTANQLFENFSTNLRELYLCNTYIDTILTSIPEDVRRGLVTLHVAGTPVHQETLEAICPSLVKLEYISLENCSDVINFEPLGKIHTLRFVDVSGAYSGDGLDALSTCGNIELFRMAESQIEGISFLSGNKNLRVLDAPGSSLTDFSLMFLENLPSLDTVILSGSMCISTINVFSTCPKIRRIFCAKTGVTNEGVAHLVECNELEELDLKLTTITDANALAGIKSLKIINVCGTVPTQDGVQDLLNRENLEVICDSFDGDEYLDG